ncbi:threonine/serine exporter [Blautia sp. OF03-13]|nr:threonine/serine exporter family protein [Blautia sp. OF03-13]RGF83380.1 threonine/serine exporter [Blautia sp. OF03-13]
MDYKLLLDTAVMAGEILLESGAETWRVEDTMLRMLRMSGLKTADVLALTTGFMVTLDDPSMDSMTVMRSVESRATDLNRIHAVNQLSRDFCEGTIDLDTLFHRVRDIYRAKPEIKKNLLAMIATTAALPSCSEPVFMKFWHLRLPDSCPVSVCMEEKEQGCSHFW